MIELRMFGGLDLRRGDRELRRVLAQPKRVALLVFLAAASPRGFHSRDVLLSLLWPESNRKRGRASLRKSLHFLRNHLGRDAFVARGDDLALKATCVWSDVAAFRESVNSRDLRSAVDLYRGGLLPGFHLSDAPEFERWIEEERRMLRRSAVRAAWRLSRKMEQSREDAQACRFGRRALAIDPLDELSIRRLIELLDRLGDRAGAVREYELAVDRLRTELDVGPSEETRLLGERLRHRGRKSWVRTDDSPPPVAPTGGPDDGGIAPAADRGPRHREGEAGAWKSSRWRGLFAAAGVLAVLAVVGLGWLVRDRPTSMTDGAATPSPPRNSVAVLPFANPGPNLEDRYLSSGVADEIRNALTSVPGLSVAARTSSVAFRDSNLDASTIADSLGVAAILEGIVRRSADRVRVSATLVEAQSGLHIWSETFEAGDEDLVTIQDRIARSVVTGLRVALDGENGGRLGRMPTTSPAAHNHYLRGRQLAFQRTSEAIFRAIEAFEQSVRADPTYAAAYAGLANAYTLARVYAFVPADSAYRWAGREISYADKAVALDPLSGEGHASLGWLTWNLGGPLDQAERHLLRGLELQPSLADAQGWYGMLLSLQGNHDGALRAHRRAVDLDPISPGVRIGYAASALWAGRPELTLREVRRAREIQPGMGGLSTAYEVWALLLLDRPENCPEIDPGSLLAYHAACLYSAGRTSDAEREVRLATGAWTPTSPVLETNGIVIYFAWSGKPQEALSWVRRGLEVSPYLPVSSPVFMQSGGLWDPALREGGGDLRTSIQNLRTEVWERVLNESRMVEMPWITP